MVRAAVAGLAAGAAAAWADPAGLGWAGLAAVLASIVVLAYVLAGAARRSAYRRTLAGLRQLPPGEFEQLVACWLRRDGWQVQLVGGPGDGGVDILARKGSAAAVVQCKRLSGDGSVGAPAVRDLYGAAVAAGATHAVLVTTARVSGAARAWAAELEGEPRLRFIEAQEVAGAARSGRVRL